VWVNLALFAFAPAEDYRTLLEIPVMKKALFILVFTMISVIGFSQTQRIAHRSHSGKDLNFIVNSSTDNFGLPVPDSSKSKKVKAKTIPGKDSLKTLPKDSLKQTPAHSPVDSARNSATRHRVYVVLHAAKYICTR
jgi:hypothetical protein